MEFGNILVAFLRKCLHYFENLFTVKLIEKYLLILLIVYTILALLIGHKNALVMGTGVDLFFDLQVRHTLTDHPVEIAKIALP